MRQGLTVLVAGALVCAPAAGQTRASAGPEAALAARLSEVGTFEFSATKRGRDGQPECRETWHFEANGTGWVRSGNQHVTLAWRVLLLQGPRPAPLLYQTPLSSDSGPDCLGRLFDPASYPRDEWGFFVRFDETGGALICGRAEFQHSFDRTKTAPLAAGEEDCWGRIVPAPKT